MGTPNYALTEAHIYEYGHWPSQGDDKVLPSGSWVRPIEYGYVPKHIKEDSRWLDADLEIYVFCYTRIGIIPIPKSKVRVR